MPCDLPGESSDSASSPDLPLPCDLPLPWDLPLPCDLPCESSDSASSPDLPLPCDLPWDFPLPREPPSSSPSPDRPPAGAVGRSGAWNSGTPAVAAAGAATGSGAPPSSGCGLAKSTAADLRLRERLAAGFLPSPPSPFGWSDDPVVSSGTPGWAFSSSSMRSIPSRPPGAVHRAGTSSRSIRRSEPQSQQSREAHRPPRRPTRSRKTDLRLSLAPRSGDPAPTAYNPPRPGPRDPRAQRER